MSFARLTPHSIRGRLTLWLATLVIVGTALFALYLYAAVANVLTDNLDRTLRIQAQQVASTYDFGGIEAGNDATGQHVDIAAVDQFASAGLSVETFDVHGRLLARSQNLRGLRLPDERHVASLVHTGPQLYTRSVSGGSYRVYSFPAVRDGHRVGLVLLVASLHEVTAMTQTLVVLLVAGSLGVILLVVGGGSLLVRRGLRPLSEMAAMAERITAQQLGQRLMLHDPPDEVARLARTFDAMLERLHEAFAVQRRFVADASHELRTPLATLHGRSEVLLLDPALDPDMRAGLVILRDEAARMGRLVANLLLVARGDEDRAVDRRPVELDLVLLEVAQQARSLASGLNIRVLLNQEDRAAILGDADLLKQALLNLVDNAIAHTPYGGQVELSLVVADGCAHLSVRDTGAGIGAEHLPHIFERFYRADPARSQRTGGAGLGLSIVRSIVESHGGHVAVESVVGHGSTFAIELPLSDQTLTLP